MSSGDVQYWAQPYYETEITAIDSIKADGKGKNTEFDDKNDK